MQKKSCWTRWLQDGIRRDLLIFWLTQQLVSLLFSIGFIYRSTDKGDVQTDGAQHHAPAVHGSSSRGDTDRQRGSLWGNGWSAARNQTISDFLKNRRWSPYSCLQQENVFRVKFKWKTFFLEVFFYFAYAIFKKINLKCDMKILHLSLMNQSAWNCYRI